MSEPKKEETIRNMESSREEDSPLFPELEGSSVKELYPELGESPHLMVDSASGEIIDDAFSKRLAKGSEGVSPITIETIETPEETRDQLKLLLQEARDLYGVDFSDSGSGHVVTNVMNSDRGE